MARTGRPTDDPKGRREALRLSVTDVEKLEYCCKQLNKPKSEVFRYALDKLYQELKK